MRRDVRSAARWLVLLSPVAFAVGAWAGIADRGPGSTVPFRAPSVSAAPDVPPQPFTLPEPADPRTEKAARPVAQTRAPVTTTAAPSTTTTAAPVVPTTTSSPASSAAPTTTSTAPATSTTPEGSTTTPTSTRAEGD